MGKKEFLKDLNKDIIVYTDCRYSVKRYDYSPEITWVDSEGKKIDEPMYSFNLLHGKKWFHDTYLNFRESELGDNIIEKYKELIAKKRAEKKYKVLTERAERKLYPKLTHIRFSNVVLTAMETFECIGEKKVTFYANGMPYRHGSFTCKKDEPITEKDILYCASTKYVAQYNVSKEKFDVKPDKKAKSFLPFHFYIGYVIELNGKQYSIYDLRNGCLTEYAKFVTDGKELDLQMEDLQKIKIIGEVTGMNKLRCLIAKTKFVE